MYGAKNIASKNQLQRLVLPREKDTVLADFRNSNFAHELIDGAAGNVGDDRSFQSQQKTEVLFDKHFQTVVVQTDGIQQPGTRFDGPRRRVADASPSV